MKGVRPAKAIQGFSRGYQGGRQEAPQLSSMRTDDDKADDAKVRGRGYISLYVAQILGTAGSSAYGTGGSGRDPSGS